jgi:hypothetical protein
MFFDKLQQHLMDDSDETVPIIWGFTGYEIHPGAKEHMWVHLGDGKVPLVEAEEHRGRW